MKPILVLCLGNDVLSDDAFGPAMEGRLRARGHVDDKVEIIFAPLAGLELLDLLAGRSKVLIVDSIVTERSAVGFIHFFPMGMLAPSKNLTSSHQISLPTALELGRQFGYDMPGEIDVLAIEAEDVETISEEMTPSVVAALGSAENIVHKWIREKLEEMTEYEKRGQSPTFCRG